MALLKRKRSGLTDPMSVVTRFVNACNRHDADGVSACLHPDFDSIQPMYPARNFRGADQVRRNWQAIFDAEPGFRLTVLRQAAADDTVWLELHGAGRDAEVAGVFVMGIQGDRVRWARIYSALIEPAPAVDESEPTSPANLREVPPPGDADTATAGAAGTEAVVEEDVIAPVVDIDGSGRSRRRRSRRQSHETAGATDAGTDGDAVVEAVTAEGEPAAEEPAVEELAVEEPAVEEPVAVVEPQPEAEVVVVTSVVPEAEVVVDAEAEPETEAVDAEAEPAADVVAEVIVPAAPVEDEPAENLLAGQEGLAAEPAAATPAPSDAEPDDQGIVWAELESEEAEAAKPAPAPESPGGAGWPSRKRGRKRR